MPQRLLVEFGAITHDNIEQLRKINTTAFPIQYQESFYKEVLERRDETLNKFAYYRGIVVGAICCRQETMENNVNRLYIMTLAVLAAYRGRGIGTQLLQSVLDSDACHNKAHEVCLHVQISNTDAMRFYERFGFSRGEMVENYYRRIDPPHCYRLYKILDDTAPVANGGASPETSSPPPPAMQSLVS